MIPLFCVNFQYPEKALKKSPEKQNPLLFWLLLSACLLALCLCVWNIRSYITGIRQDYPESTQIAALEKSTRLGIFLFTVSASSFLLCTWYLFKKKTGRYIASIAVCIPLIVIGILSAAAAAFILVAIGGNI
jgi:hypothetical protein